MKVTNELIGERIGKYRDRLHMTQKQLAEKSGVGLSTIKNTESNQQGRTLSKIDDLLRIAEALEISPYFLLTEINDENHVACEQLGLANDTINRLKEMKNPLVKAVIDRLVDDWSILIHLAEYLNSDFKTVQRESTLEFFPVSDLSGFNGDDLETVNRLRLLDDFKRIREENKGGKEK